MLLIFRKNHKATFLLLALLSDEKRGKSHLRGFSILLKNSLRVHELVAGSSAWQVRAAQKQCKSRRFYRSPQLHATTRANISHEKVEQIRAHIVRTPAISARRA